MIVGRREPRARLTRILEELSRELDVGSRRYKFGPSGNCDVRVAASLEDRLAAWGLVYDSYLEKEYARPSCQRLWYSIFDALPETTTLVAELDGRVVATLTLVFDSPVGLPAEEIFRPEIDELRRRGRRACEIVSLVSEEPGGGMGRELIKHLFKLAYLTAHHVEEATDFLITVNPRHVRLYERMLLFKALGQPRDYDKVGGAPAVLLHLDLVAAWDNYRERFDGLPAGRNLYRFFLEGAEDLREWLRRSRRPMDEEALRKYFVEDRPLILEAPQAVRHYVEDCYPFYDLVPQPAEDWRRAYDPRIAQVTSAPRLGAWSSEQSA